MHIWHVYGKKILNSYRFGTPKRLLNGAFWNKWEEEVRKNG